MNLFPESWPVGEAVFLLIGVAALLSALAVITRRNPVAAVAWLVVHFVATACLYVLLSSQFLAVVQVLVYAGAIMVLFLFVIMLLAIDKQPEPGKASGMGRKVLAGALGLVMLTAVGKLALSSGTPAAATVDAATEDSVQWLSRELFSNHLVAFEFASLVLIAAMAGVMVFTTRRQAGPAGGAR
jgi:NADH-quinone oxidoreductase subunit J